MPAGLPTFRSDVITVNVDVAVLDNKGRFIPNIPRGNFRILEDNVPQQVSNFGTGEAPMTVCLVIEFSNLFQRYWSETWYQTLTAAYGFIETLKPEDYVAVVAYDMRPEILSRFHRPTSGPPTRPCDGCASPPSRKSNLFDALTDTAERMTDIEGRKAIVLISSGDRHLQQADLRQDPQDPPGRRRAHLRHRPDAGICRELVRRLRLHGPHRSAWTSCRPTTSCAPSPRRPAARRSSRASTASSRASSAPSPTPCATSTSLTYQPTNQTRDGKFRKIKVELVNPADQRTAADHRRKGKADQVHHHRQEPATRRRAKSNNDPQTAISRGEVKQNQSRAFPVRYKYVDSAVSALLPSPSPS